MKTIVKILSLFSILLFAVSSVQAGKKDPTAVLFQVKGQVEYSRDGKSWKKVRRNKFLFAGYQVKSQGDGSGKITIKASGEKMDLNPNTVLEVTASGLKVVRGNLEESGQTNSLVAGLVKKFSKSQSYTTVRRSASTKELDAVRSVVVSNDFPYLVWDNLDKSYSYKLTVGDDVYNIPSSNETVVRTKIKPFAGSRDFKITALKNNAVVAELEPFKSRGEIMNHSISWLEQPQQEELNQIVSNLTNEYGEDSFILGTYYEKMDMWVAAMDQYKKYLQENPDDVEMTPYLFRVYKKLKLDGLYEKELSEWNQATAQ